MKITDLYAIFIVKHNFDGQRNPHFIYQPSKNYFHGKLLKNSGSDDISSYKPY